MPECFAVGLDELGLRRWTLTGKQSGIWYNHNRVLILSRYDKELVNYGYLVFILIYFPRDDILTWILVFILLNIFWVDSRCIMMKLIADVLRFLPVFCFITSNKVHLFYKTEVQLFWNYLDTKLLFNLLYLYSFSRKFDFFCDNIYQLLSAHATFQTFAVHLLWKCLKNIFRDSCIFNEDNVLLCRDIYSNLQ